MSRINYISISAVAKLTGMKEREVLQKVASGDFPKPLLNRNPSVWNKAHISDWLVDQVQQQGYSL